MIWWCYITEQSTQNISRGSVGCRGHGAAGSLVRNFSGRLGLLLRNLTTSWSAQDAFSRWWPAHGLHRLSQQSTQYNLAGAGSVEQPRWHASHCIWFATCAQWHFSLNKWAPTPHHRNSFIHSFIRSFIHSFMHSFIHIRVKKTRWQTATRHVG